MEHVVEAPGARQAEAARGMGRLRVAMLLEVPLPGVGALCLGRRAQGFLWLAGTVMGLAIALLVAGRGLLQLVPACAVPGGLLGAACAPVAGAAAQPLVWVVALALLWLNIRLALLTSQASLPGVRARVGAGRVALIGLALALCAGGLWLAYDWLGAASEFAAFPTVIQRAMVVDRLASDVARLSLGALYVAAGAWLVGLRALGRSSWLVVALEVFAGTMVVWAAILGARYVILVTAGLPPAISSDLLANESASMVTYLPQLILAAALGLSFAAWAAPWRAIQVSAGARSHATPGAALVFALVTLALVIGLALVPSALHAIPSGYDILNDAGRDRFWSVAGSALLLGLTVAGASIAARPWRRG